MPVKDVEVTFGRRKRPIRSLVFGQQALGIRQELIVSRAFAQCAGERGRKLMRSAMLLAWSEATNRGVHRVQSAEQLEIACDAFPSRAGGKGSTVTSFRCSIAA